jgi:hypothetical protein
MKKTITLLSLFVPEFSRAKKRGKKFGSRLYGFPYFHFSKTEKGAIALAKKEWHEFLEGHSQAAFESDGICPAIDTICIDSVKNI